ncbi:MAG TPA: hypothetical protein VL177_04615, partial [Terriglobales bacterium]|nr:hypothetical protein [Terriglobales bacterium]
MMAPEQAVFAAILVCMAGAAITLLTARSRLLTGWLAMAAIAASSLLIFDAARRVLLGGVSPQPLQVWASATHAISF